MLLERYENFLELFVTQLVMKFSKFELAMFSVWKTKFWC